MNGCKHCNVSFNPVIHPDMSHQPMSQNAEPEENTTIDKELIANGETVYTGWRGQYLLKYYHQQPGWQSSTEQWIKHIRKYMPKGARVLEVGGGPIKFTTRIMREHAREIVGLDIDPIIKSKNPFLDKAVVYDGGVFPFRDNSFDFVISRWVNEHLRNPALHFREINRVLSSGGVYLFCTVNLYHYKSIVARLTPHWMHVPLVRWSRQFSAEQHDPYPTCYRANTRRQIRNLLRKAGLKQMFFRISENYPSYGMGSKALFHAFMMYERTVNSSPRLEGLRHTIECAAKKPA
jgi:ubiquinone/menaquinone biosynthesis C-methylase UbiE